MGNGRIERFDLFLESHLERNKGIPGNNPGDPNYLSDVEKRAKERLNITSKTTVPEIGGNLGRLIYESSALTKGHERELEMFAEKIIKNLYAPLIREYNIKLDIKLNSGPEIKNMIDIGKEKIKSPRDAKEQEKKRPVIKVRGLDFVMLIHEAVKGIWRFLSMNSVPKDPAIAKAIENVMGDLAQEPEEWRYGPEIAADLRDFINENPKVDLHPNIRERIWIRMVNPKIFPDEKFLELMRGILMKTPEARKTIDGIIDSIVKKLDADAEYAKAKAGYEREMKIYQKKMEEKAKREREKKKSQTGSSKTETPNKPQESPYAKMSQNELSNAVIKAYKENNIDLVKEISKYLKK
jgi:hypothetical protein